MYAFIGREKKIPVSVENLGDYQFFQRENPETIDLETFQDHQAVVIDSREIRFSLGLVNRFRGASTLNLYLKPIFLYSELPIEDSYIMALVDGTVDAATMRGSVSSRSEQLAEAVSQYKDIEQDTFESTAVVKTLRFMVTRGRRLEPVTMPKSRFGFSYPFLGAQFRDRDDARLFSILDLIDNENLMEKHFVDRIHLCNRCKSSFINFRELCPRCHSADLEVSDLIHHFSCGNVDPETKYKVHDQLVCPKCKKILRHIGMDYDKPSVVHTCRVCQTTSQDPEVWGLCRYCGNDTPSERLLYRDLKSYSLSSASLNFALNGLHFTLADFLKGHLEIVNYPTFQTIAHYENERALRYKRPSVIVNFQLLNFSELVTGFGQRREEVALEMARIIKDTLRDSDIITLLNDNTFVFLLVETPRENAEAVGARLDKRFQGLMASNFPGITLQTHLQAMELTEFIDRKEQEEKQASHE